MATTEERLQRLEDQIEIYQVLSAYGYAADSCSNEVLYDIYAPDGVYAVKDLADFVGKKGMDDLMALKPHLELIGGGAAHMSTLPYVKIEGDRAVATCHFMVPKHVEGGYVISRLSASRAELERKPGGGWHITRRTHEQLNGSETARALLGRAREVPPPRAKAQAS